MMCKRCNLKNKRRRIPVVGGMTSWAALLGLVWMSMPVSAFTTGELEATNAVDAAFELVDKLGYTQSGTCELAALNSESNHIAKGRFFTAQCPGGRLFLKVDGQSHAEIFDAVIQLQEKMPTLSGSILQPLAEFSFRKGGGQLGHLIPRDYYSAYRWVEGVTLGDLLQNMHQSGFDAGRLAGLYRQLGRLVGAMHRAGLTEANKPLQQLRSRQVHSDLHPRNLMVTENDALVILDVDSFPAPGEEAFVHQAVVRDFPDFLLLRGHFVLDSPLSETLLAMLPEVSEALLGAYCQSLLGDDKAAACMSEIRELLIEDAYRYYELVVKYPRLFEKMAEKYPKLYGCLRESGAERGRPVIPVIVDRDELDRRLDAVFGPAFAGVCAAHSPVRLGG